MKENSAIEREKKSSNDDETRREYFPQLGMGLVTPLIQFHSYNTHTASLIYSAFREKEVVGGNHLGNEHPRLSHPQIAERGEPMEP